MKIQSSCRVSCLSVCLLVGRWFGSHALLVFCSADALGPPCNSHGLQVRVGITRRAVLQSLTSCLTPRNEVPTESSAQTRSADEEVMASVTCRWVKMQLQLPSPTYPVLICWGKKKRAIILVTHLLMTQRRRTTTSEPGTLPPSMLFCTVCTRVVVVVVFQRQQLSLKLCVRQESGKATKQMNLSESCLQICLKV